MTTERTATCTCGALRAICRGEPLRNAICHCLACKQRTGSAFSWNATYAAEQVTTSGPFSTFEREADSGRWCRFHFCPTCGATVFYEIEARPGRIIVPVGAFTDPDFPAPTFSVRGTRRNGWTASGAGAGMVEEP